jgi:mRNA interferase MazF
VTPTIRRGALVWVSFDPTQGREQRGTRPALVMSSTGYLQSVRDLVIVVPITSVDRGWPHHVPIHTTSGPDDVRLTRRSFAMTEQPRTISRQRIGRTAGTASDATVTEVAQWLRDFIGL